jgi:hypothetical protein
MRLSNHRKRFCAAAFYEPKGRASNPLRADGFNHDFLQRKARGRRAPVLRSTNAKRGHQPSATAEAGRSDAPYNRPTGLFSNWEMIQPQPTVQTFTHFHQFLKLDGFGEIKIGPEIVSTIRVHGTIGRAEDDDDQPL